MRLFIAILLLSGSSAFGVERLSGDDAQEMFDILNRSKISVHEIETGEKFASAFNLLCIDEVCTADINFIDPSAGRKELNSKDARRAKELLSQVGFEPTISKVSGSAGKSFLGGANVSCEVVVDKGFKACAFQ